MERDTSTLGFRLEANGVDPSLPLLYRIWTKAIAQSEETTIYVGQTKTGVDRPFSRYDLNTRRLMDGKGPLNGKRFRCIHHDLRAAHGAGHQIGVILVRNVDLSIESITQAERDLQRSIGLATSPRTQRRMLDDAGRIFHTSSNLLQHCVRRTANS